MNTINKIIKNHVGEKAEPLFKEIRFQLPEWVILEYVKDNQYLIQETTEGIFNVLELLENPIGNIELICKEVIDNQLYLIYRQEYQTQIIDSFTFDDPRIQINLENEGFHIEEAIATYLIDKGIIPRFSSFVYDGSYTEIDYQETDRFIASWYFVSPLLAKVLTNSGEICLDLGNSYLWGSNEYNINKEEVWSDILKIAKLFNLI